MKKRDFRKYIAYVKERRHSTIADYYIEKDYFISLFLSTWQKLKEEKKASSLDALIFKGGTLLVRNYLQYPRISEDLDFTHTDSNKLRLIDNTNKREQEIKKRILPILEDIKIICDACGFDFNNNRTNTRYVKVRNSRAVYVLHFYYTSFITNEEIPVKVEINFLENIMHHYIESRINTIIDMDTFLKSIDYNLENITIKTYSLDEIILEKYRAILTREAIKERDILDLYLIHQRGNNVLKISTSAINKKIQSGIIIAHDMQKNLEKNCQLLQRETSITSDDDVSRFTLINIDNAPYEEFKNHLIKKLKDICLMQK
jgi:predicted nucleotidyltransferase component of viral defense system